MSSKEALRKLRRIIKRALLIYFPLLVQKGGGGGTGSYKDKLVGEILGAYEQAFGFENIMEEEVELDDETINLNAGIAALNLTSERKSKM